MSERTYRMGFDKYDPRRCAGVINDPNSFWYRAQCFREPGYGQDRKYCVRCGQKLNFKLVEEQIKADQREEREAAWQRHLKRHPELSPPRQNSDTSRATCRGK